jgi:hypothetical protein
MTRLIQIQHGGLRRVALVEEPNVRCLEGYDSVYTLAQAALNGETGLHELIRRHATGAVLAYDPIYHGKSEWRLLPPIDFPGEPARCLVSGTGLTHLGSAKNRQAMHAASETETDSMKMFRWGVEGGKPAPGSVGTAPEWFYKGCGTILHAHGEPLVVPAYAEDGGEEAEIAGIYLVGFDGKPRRLGMALGNEFSDHRFEKRNYLNLAGSKIRTCSLGPELTIDPEFQTVTGKAAIERAGHTVWSKEIRTGETEMCHSLRNIEHHHFKFETHRRAGDVHVHYYGACALSFGDGVQLTDGDMMCVEFAGFGRPLRNPISVLASSSTPQTPVAVQSIP